eukprot:TRINITY_DN1980_c0_g1_i1.p1 TRINITY_DN1980_c0_g1~~TRINITY_DN1980_c0_g1_i1.p1  ORF type:complete len:457 (-),score=72.67 TRINITY_DN1980_c0_g1_i1:59-1396(-)
MQAGFQDYKAQALEIVATLPSELDEATMAIIGATAPVVVQNIETIAQTFYPYMLDKFPATKNYFNAAHQVSSGCPHLTKEANQPFALAKAIVRYVGHLGSAKDLRESMELAAQKHCALSIRAEHYPIVYECFMHAVGQVLGDAVTEEIAAAWGKVVLFIARAFIEREVEIYESAVNKPNGWFGWKEFTVTNKVAETADIVSLTLEPKDGSKLPDFTSGQYISLRLHNLPKAYAPVTLRQYSVTSTHHSTSFSISVKVEKATEHTPDGLVSTYLQSVEIGKVLEVGMPFGTLKPPTNPGYPTVLISGGIGSTVAMAMINHYKYQAEATPVYVIHSVRDGSCAVFQETLKKLSHENPDRFKVLLAYSKPREVDQEGVDYDVGARVDINIVKNFVPSLTTANYVICGPAAMVHDIMVGLLKEGVERSRVQFECFGPLANQLDEFAEAK